MTAHVDDGGGRSPATLPPPPPPPGQSSAARSYSGSSTWADTALVSRKLPTVENLLSPPTAATAADGKTTASVAASLNPHWRSGMPRARKSVLFSFGSGRTSSGGGGGDGGSGGPPNPFSTASWWPSFLPRRTSSSSAAAAAASKSSSVVTLHGGRNSDARLAKLSSARGDEGEGMGSLGPTLETLELEFVAGDGRRRGGGAAHAGDGGGTRSVTRGGASTVGCGGDSNINGCDMNGNTPGGDGSSSRGNAGEGNFEAPPPPPPPLASGRSYPSPGAQVQRWTAMKNRE
ncbi:unnamed protein product [Scytosiphon promiscuus]